jgi:L-threonylcarbamoyladenylate synthase
MIGTDIHFAKHLLNQGEAIAIPTETVYGLAANALQPFAVAKIFEIKNRPTFNPLICHLYDRTQLKSYVTHVPSVAFDLMDAFCPGPITFILPKKDIIPDIVSAGLDTVGIRFPKHLLTQKLLALCDYPLAAPSANPFGYISPTNPFHVQEQLGAQLKYILDGGNCEVGIESTIIGFNDNQPIIYRLGGLSIEEIEQVVGKVTIQIHENAKPLAPGQLSTHYSPKKKLTLVNDISDLQSMDLINTSLVTFTNQMDYKVKYQYILSPKNDFSEAAVNLFNLLRKADSDDSDNIIAVLLPEIHLGRAINDRLKRASKQ